MLVLKRKIGESVSIGNDIVITLQKSNSNNAHFVIEAPRSVVVMRSELINAAKNEENTTTNTQARLEGSDKWNDYGDVTMYEAAKQEAVKEATECSCSGYEWLVEVRWENDDTMPVIMVRVKTFVSAEVINPRRGAD